MQINWKSPRMENEKRYFSRRRHQNIVSLQVSPSPTVGRAGEGGDQREASSPAGKPAIGRGDEQAPPPHA